MKNLSINASETAVTMTDGENSLRLQRTKDDVVLYANVGGRERQHAMAVAGILRDMLKRMAREKMNYTRRFQRLEKLMKDMNNVHSFLTLKRRLEEKVMEVEVEAPAMAA